MISNKLYKQYFPIETEISKMQFLSTKRKDIIRYLERELSNSKASFIQVELEYVSKLKKTVSFLGKIKWGNVVHNAYIISEMENDCRIYNLGNWVAGIEKLLYALKMNEDISIEAVNMILQSMNRTYRHTVLRIALLTITIITVLCIWK